MIDNVLCFSIGLYTGVLSGLAFAVFAFHVSFRRKPQTWFRIIDAYQQQKERHETS